MRMSRDASSRSRSRSRRAATSRVDRLWDYGVIPYEIDSNFSGIGLTLHHSHRSFQVAVQFNQLPAGNNLSLTSDSQV